jgi:putative ABC transport system ATP-binding protein
MQPARSQRDGPILGDRDLLQLRGVSKTYAHGAAKVHALAELDLAFPRGQLTVILGPSGSGKTTLLNLIGALDRPSSGSIVFSGVEMSQLSDRDLGRFRRDHVGFVFQFFNLIPTLTARENVEFAAELVLPEREAVTRAAKTYLGLVGLAERADHFPGELSGGEQQRVAIARALAKEPELLLCDEPTGNLDFRTGREILSFLQRLTREHGTTCLLVTHNLAIAPIGDRVIRLRDGQIASDSTNATPVDAVEIEW